MHRVVITGLGVVAPNANGLAAFDAALRNGQSGIRAVPRTRELGFACQVGGIPQGVEELLPRYFTQEDLLAMNENMIFSNIAAMDCWRDAGLPRPATQRDPDTGAIIGTGMGGPDTICERVTPMVNAGKVRRLGSTMVEQCMASSVSAKTAGLLGLGNQVTTNSSACSTGCESVVMAAERIRHGMAKRMLAGGSEAASPYVWAAFDAMRVLDRDHNDAPAQASRPMSRSAGGFVPGSGAGLLMLESLESAKERGARIYAEILGGAINCGGHRDGGSMTAPNPAAVQECIRKALVASGITPDDVDAINGHLTGTFADPLEVENWSKALERPPERFPYINATKSLLGHGLGAAGGMELVAVTLQLQGGYVHGSLNCEDLHERLQPFAKSIPHQTVLPERLEVIAKASFGFGDVNACVIVRRWRES
ncbi:MAG: beta-ketoacyl-[acyl-carrier-protein] synthase family protein [Myxococcota bacterium]